MGSRMDERVLAALKALPPRATGSDVMEYLEAHMKPNLISRWFPGLAYLQGDSVGAIHTSLENLEDRGILWSEWFPQQGNRRRKYYHLKTEMAD